MRSITLAGVALVLLIDQPSHAGTPERGEESDGPSDQSGLSPSGKPAYGTPERAPAESPKFVTAAEAGLALPFSVSARASDARAWARVLGGYDAAARAFRATS